MIESENDSELLRRYVSGQSEAAFAELVGRYLGLVYSAALRQVSGDVAAAQDIAQAVFVDLARKASSLTQHPSLAGWLYTSTRFLAANARREMTRRAAREQIAHAMNQLHPAESEPDWSTLQPVLDEAMHDLEAAEREAVLWRFFEQRSFADIGERLGLKENSARMRVERALDKLRAALKHRGITSTAIALGANFGAASGRRCSGRLIGTD
jgi:RNA polymerase sigma factor (sigma-70 family)